MSDTKVSWGQFNPTAQAVQVSFAQFNPRAVTSSVQVSWGQFDPQASTARSGYWRLFYYNLQEQSLAKDKEREQKQREEAPQGTVEAEKAEPVAKPKPKPKQRTREPVPRVEPVTESLTVHPRPVYNYPQQKVDSITPLLRVVSNEFYQWYRSSEPLVTAMLERKAANDEDEEDAIHLLLMAA